jgi:hypothetical protein
MRAHLAEGEMMCLITGATGEVGSRVVRLLLERGIRPRVFVRGEESARALFGDRVDVSVGTSPRKTPSPQRFRGRTPFFS